MDSQSRRMYIEMYKIRPDSRQEGDRLVWHAQQALWQQTGLGNNSQVVQALVTVLPTTEPSKDDVTYVLAFTQSDYEIKTGLRLLNREIYIDKHMYKQIHTHTHTPLVSSPGEAFGLALGNLVGGVYQSQGWLYHRLGCRTQVNLRLVCA